MPAKKMRKVTLSFVDLAGDPSPEQGKDYGLVSASSSAVGQLPYPGTQYTLLRLQVVNLYIEDLPDFTNKNEALLRLTAHTRTVGDPANKEDLSFALEFNVKDRAYCPGFLERIVLRNVMLRSYLELGVNLVELDKQAVGTYDKVSRVVADAGLAQIDALNSIPYLKVATKLFDGLIHTFGKDSDDLVWSESPTIYTQPGPGSAYLRTGIYVIHESGSLFSTRAGNQKSSKPMPLGELAYRDGELRHKSDPKYPIANHLILGVLLEAVPE